MSKPTDRNYAKKATSPGLIEILDRDDPRHPLHQGDVAGNRADARRQGFNHQTWSLLDKETGKVLEKHTAKARFTKRLKRATPHPLSILGIQARQAAEQKRLRAELLAELDSKRQVA